MRTLGRRAVFPAWILFVALLGATFAASFPSSEAWAQTPPRIPGLPGFGKPAKAPPPPVFGDSRDQVETAVVVRQAMMRLPAEQRAAVLAVDMHGYSVSDAAALLNVAEGTVKSRCSRGRARLAVLLRQLAPAAPG